MKWSVVTVSKMESKDILEWACWHKLMGAEKIYLYDALADDAHGELKKLILEGFVEFIPWTRYPAQYPAYEDARVRFTDTALAFIDADELIVPLKGTVSQILDETLKENVAGLAIGWDMFGPNGHDVRPPTGLMIENYTKRENRQGECFTKCIMLPEFMETGIWDPHWFRVKDGYHIVREDGSILRWGEHHHRLPWPYPKEKIKLNHYFTRSKEDFMRKYNRRGPDGNQRKLEDFDVAVIRCNEVEDTTAHAWINELKVLMKCYRS